jgi:hypothetical protein
VIRFSAETPGGDAIISFKRPERLSIGATELLAREAAEPEDRRA